MDWLHEGAITLQRRRLRLRSKAAPPPSEHNSGDSRTGHFWRNRSGVFSSSSPPEYRRLGCLPAEQFVPQLMAFVYEPYYLALLTAAQRHGAAHQRSQVVQVMVRKNRAAIECGQVRVEFVARGDLDKMPVAEVNTPRGVVRFSTPEVTALELVGYPNHSGGLSNVATVVSELAEELDREKLVAAARLSPVSWSQRHSDTCSSSSDKTPSLKR